MLFSSTTFIYLFLPLVLVVYYLLLRKSRNLKNVFLFLASIFFYACGEPKFVLVMLASVFVNWFFGLLVDKFKKQDKISLAKLSLALACVLDLSLLFVFKYLNFTEAVICSAFGLSPKIAEIVLPIGISFFTFQAMSYVIDVYRDRGEMQKNILNVGLYIAFFPQLIAGPIVRYETVAYEINNRIETKDDFFDGFARFIIGLGKKVLLANTFGILADKGFNMCAAGKELSVMFSWLCAVSYTLQIYFDFSGYSDMAIGLGRMFGFHFLENFNYPYISRTVSEFWRRWHMSLGSWFRDYVYIPLGGSRVKRVRLVFNLFVVWLLTGIWHGANWTFVVWGLMYFALLAVEKLLNLKSDGGKLSGVFKWLYTMFFVIMGWVIFRSDTLGIAFTYIKSMFGVAGNSFADGMFAGYFKQNAIMLVIGAICSVPVCKLIGNKIKQNTFTDILYVCALTIVFVLCIANLVSSSYNPFIYFNF